MLTSVAAIAAGAALGALLRWGLATRLNPLLPAMPLGTLVANLAGGFAVGVAVALLAQRPDWPPQLRLFVVTGLLGGLTTFSTFSAGSWPSCRTAVWHGRWRQRALTCSVPCCSRP